MSSVPRRRGRNPSTQTQTEKRQSRDDVPGVSRRRTPICSPSQSPLRWTLPPTKKKKNKRWPRKTLKRGVEKRIGGGSGKRKPGHSKHPLRVPGKKPGEGFFICQARDHIAKLCPKKAEWERNKICLLCRPRGHGLKSCPNKGEDNDKKLCYNRGGAGHSLCKCPLPLQDVLNMVDEYKGNRTLGVDQSIATSGSKTISGQQQAAPCYLLH